MRNQKRCSGGAVFRSIGRKRTEGVLGRGLVGRRSDERDIEEQGERKHNSTGQVVKHYLI